MKCFIRTGVVFFMISTIAGLTTIINDGQVLLETSVEGSNLRVTITGNTTGFVGFGISPDGSMTGADIAIGGFNDTSREGYITDYIGTGNERPTEDDIQNLELISASQNVTHTTVEFLRPLNATDDQDLTVTSGPLNILWACGVSDVVEYHLNHRGSVKVDILGG